MYTVYNYTYGKRNRNNAFVHCPKLFRLVKGVAIVEMDRLDDFSFRK